MPATFPANSKNVRPRQSKRLRHEQRILLWALAGGAPAVVFSFYCLWQKSTDAKVQWTLGVLIGCVWLACAWALRERVVRPLQTTSNLIAALHEEDFSLRPHQPNPDDALGELLGEVSLLSETLRDQKRNALAATSLLAATMNEIEVAVFTFDETHQLRFVNRAGEKLLAKPAAALRGCTADELDLAECLNLTVPTIQDKRFAGATGRWGIRHGTFRDHGLSHHIVMLTDLSQALRAEERKAWQQIVRVLGHELNNSLTPIQSIAGSLQMLLKRTPQNPELAHDWEEDAQKGLSVIASRAESLRRFMSAYAQLAKLPPPTLAPVKLAPLLHRVVNLETRLTVRLHPGPELTVQADNDQLEQLLINLIRNAVDAALETGGGVELQWLQHPQSVEILLRDEGPGIAGTANLFVPFFTTKPGGSGIGLVLSRQIAEAHQGTLTLENRPAQAGCLTRLRLPFSPPSAN